MPAALVPFMFVLEPAGQGLLLMGSVKNLATADWTSIAWVTLQAVVGIGAIAAGFQGWMIKRANIVERCLLIAAGVALVLPGTTSDLVGFSAVTAVLALQLLRRQRGRASVSSG